VGRPHGQSPHGIYWGTASGARAAMLTAPTTPTAAEAGLVSVPQPVWVWHRRTATTATAFVTIV
jgi:hypothetical protein